MFEIEYREPLKRKLEDAEIEVISLLMNVEPVRWWAYGCRQSGYLYSVNIDLLPSYEGMNTPWKHIPRVRQVKNLERRRLQRLGTRSRDRVLLDVTVSWCTRQCSRPLLWCRTLAGIVC